MDPVNRLDSSVKPKACDPGAGLAELGIREITRSHQEPKDRDPGAGLWIREIA